MRLPGHDITTDELRAALIEAGEDERHVDCIIAATVERLEARFGVVDPMGQRPSKSDRQR